MDSHDHPRFTFKVRICIELLFYNPKYIERERFKDI